MDAARWQRMDELFARAIALPSGERNTFLAHECRHDLELRRELDSLLAHAHDDGFLESSGVDWATAVVMGTGPRPAEGERLGRFEVLGRLGTGGMGEVYLAHDPVLQRRIALKVLPSELADDGEWIERFRQEALAASALNHPNLLTVHEIVEAGGTDVLVSEMIDGATLRERMRAGPLPPTPALEIVLQVCRGLAAAHAAGLVHRDVKPDNVMVRGDGLVKLLDFGLAEASPGTARTGTEVLAERAGTHGYMSPEQARGHAVDARSDVWSVGALLYELLTGERPPAVPSGRRAARWGAPAPAESKLAGRLPAAVLDLVRRTLASDPALRPADASELASEIERLLASRRRLRSLRRASAPAAAAVLVAALAGAVSGFTLREPALKGTRSHRLAGSPNPAPDPAARELYAQGRALWSRRTVPAMVESIAYFERATERDPSFAAAFALLADAHLMLATATDDPNRERLLARAAVDRALSLDPRSGQAHAVVAMEAQNFAYDWERAEREYRRAIELSPGDPTALHRLGEMLALLGRFDEGIALLERAREIDPRSPIIGSDAAKVLWFARRYASAERAAAGVLARWPDFALAHFIRGISLASLGRRDEARAELDRFLALDGSPAARWVAAAPYARAGYPGRAQEILDEMVDASRSGVAVHPPFVASALAVLEEPKEAMDWLERAYRENTILLGVGVHPFFDSLHADPRFRSLCARLRLPVRSAGGDAGGAREPGFVRHGH